MIGRIISRWIAVVIFLSLISKAVAAAPESSDRLAGLEAEVKALKEELVAEKADLAELKDSLRTLEEKQESAAPESQDLVVKLGINEKQYVFGDYWDDGLFFKTPGDVFTARIGGSLNLDARWTHAQPALQDYFVDHGRIRLQDSSELRRARIYLMGTMYNDFFYKFQVDFQDTLGSYYIHDAFVGLMNIPAVGAVLIGHAARAWGLNPVPDENWLTFMEWAPPFGFSIGQLLGVAAGNAYFDEHFNWAIQVGKTAGIHCNEIGESYNLNLRFTGTPWYIDGGRSMLHQGVSYTYRGSSDETRYMAGPSFSFGDVPPFIDIGNLDTRNVNGFNYSAALCEGPLGIQGEYYGMLVDQKDGPSSTFFQGLYVEASYYLTGENRGSQYIMSYGGFDRRIQPRHNFNMSKGTWGAFELAARYSWMSLDDDNIRGGILN
ncbi:MAG: porin [Candidatus Euphemobacter frigidus]|nr:porin [Candidatus Euphemobacter frigidus]MDP8276548.1 porin [Candidatus Euphemobacter frigidus]